MGVLDEFDRMWCSARALFGDPAPVGAALSRPLPAVPPAGAAHGWHGDGADRYRVEAGVHRRTLVSVGALDSAADRDVLTALATAEHARRELDSVRARVHWAAAAIPRDNQRMLASIAGIGCRDVATTIDRARCELRGISGALAGTGADYRSMTGRTFREAGPDPRAPGTAPDPEPAPDPVTDPPPEGNTVAGTPGRPLGNELTAAEWRIARLSPLQLDEREQAKDQGRRITAEAGIGTFTRHGDKVINIDPGLATEGPTHRVNALAHELGHALYQPEVDRRTRDGYVTSYLDGEGAAVWNGIRIEREILAAGGADIIPPNHNDDYFERIYDAAGDDPQSYRDAIHQIGQVYADLTPSNDVTKNYRDYYSGEYRCSFLRGLIGKCERP